MMSIVTDSKTIDEICEMPIEDLIDYLQKKGRGRFTDPETLAKAIRKAVRGSYRLGKVMRDSVDAVLSVYYSEIKTYQKLIKDLEKAITDIVQTLPEERYCNPFQELGQSTLPALSLKLVVLIVLILRLN